MKSFINLYKTPILISIALAVVLTALPVLKDSFTIGLVFFLSFIGIFVLDLDYLIHAYFIEPEKDFSKTLRAYLKHKDSKGALNFIQIHKDDVADKTLNSALFQVVFSLFCIFVIYSDVYYPVKAFVLSIMANSIYRLSEVYFTGKAKSWFWSFKKQPDKKGVLVYALGILAVFIYCLTLV